MALAFRHVDSGTVAIVADAEGYGAPDWAALPDPPSGSGPWKWTGSWWMLDDAAAWMRLRAERDARLATCDWTQLPDVSAEIRESWRAYRQALRDMPETADPFVPEWPTPPAP